MEGGVNELKQYALSDADIRQILGDDIPILTYPQLREKSSIEECFDSKGRCILLILTTGPTEGHWVCMLQKRNGIHFFDPYGMSPVDQFRGMPKALLETLQQDPRVLPALLKRSGRPIYYNPIPFQTNKEGINTCGRWCVARLMYAPHSLEYFHKVVEKAKAKGMSGDTFVSGLIANWLAK